MSSKKRKCLVSSEERWPYDPTEVPFGKKNLWCFLAEDVALFGMYFCFNAQESLLMGFWGLVDSLLHIQCHQPKAQQSSCFRHTGKWDPEFAMLPQDICSHAKWTQNGVPASLTLSSPDQCSHSLRRPSAPWHSHDSDEPAPTCCFHKLDTLIRCESALERSLLNISAPWHRELIESNANPDHWTWEKKK